MNVEACAPADAGWENAEVLNSLHQVTGYNLLQFLSQDPNYIGEWTYDEEVYEDHILMCLLPPTYSIMCDSASRLEFVISCLGFVGGRMGECMHSSCCGRGGLSSCHLVSLAPPSLESARGFKSDRKTLSFLKPGGGTLHGNLCCRGFGMSCALPCIMGPQKIYNILFGRTC